MCRAEFVEMDMRVMKRERIAAFLGAHCFKLCHAIHAGLRFDLSHRFKTGYARVLQENADIACLFVSLARDPYYLQT